MTARKGELTKAQLDRDFPHQVAVPAWRCAESSGGRQIQIFCANLRIAPRHHTVRRNDKDFIVYCFADPQQYFQAAFGGETFKPSERGRGRSWWQWKNP